VNKSLGGLGFSARLRNYVDLSEAANIELSFSALTGKRARAIEGTYQVLADAPTGGTQLVDVNAVLARQSTFGADFTYRWRPLQQGIYQSFILQSEVMRQVNARGPSELLVQCSGGFEPDTCTVPLVTESRAYNGAYVLGRLQTSQRTFAVGRYDYLQDPSRDGRTLNAGSVYLEVFPSEFSKLVAGYEALAPAGGSMTHRLLVQAVFALGPHKPHPF
jgi:hypothetical protein